METTASAKAATATTTATATTSVGGVHHDRARQRGCYDSSANVLEC